MPLQRSRSSSESCLPLGACEEQQNQVPEKSLITSCCGRVFVLTWRTIFLTRKLATALPPQAELLTMSPTSWIFSAPSTAPSKIYKVSQDAAQLQNEFELQEKIGTVFHHIAQEYMSRQGQQLPLPYVPICFDYFPTIHSSSIADMFKSHTQLSKNCGVYSMEYIRPLNRYHVKYLVKRHLFPTVQDVALQRARSTHNLSKICLGGLKPLSDSARTGMHDRLTYLDHLIKEHVDIYQLASVMGSALAVLHWVCETDARGVQFMLGCDRRGKVQLWLIDFAKCRPFERTTHVVSTQLVDAITENGCVWPKWIDLEPFRNVWKKFKNAYVQMSLRLFAQGDELNPSVHLPLLFIKTLAKLRGVKSTSNTCF